MTTVETSEIQDLNDRLKKQLQAEREKLKKCAEIVTCVNCPENETCEYAFDSYNTYGDCMAVK